IDVYCSLKHGTKISKAASNIQSAIFNSIKTMTAIELNQINVHITHITVEK
ncbi:MAG: Asp23/Gls24 family envelope stress response protein, partial [Staphylococcus lugdunensis]|nr:Asp23/Gls24 family envelope stress response protein [Staphylococcus lugdunensis]